MRPRLMLSSKCHMNMRAGIASGKNGHTFSMGPVESFNSDRAWRVRTNKIETLPLPILPVSPNRFPPYPLSQLFVQCMPRSVLREGLR